MEEYIEIRLRRRDDQSVRRIARELGHSRKAVEKVRFAWEPAIAPSVLNIPNVKR